MFAAFRPEGRKAHVLAPTQQGQFAAVRQKLFGSWEGNWIAFNDGSDIALPSAQGPELGFLMYPQAEVASARLDCLDADSFRYAMTAREITI